jgi:lysophospholipase L1-like esterase
MHTVNSRFKTFRQNVLLIAISIILALCLAEITLRLFDLAPSTGVFTVTDSDFEKVPGIFTPNQQLVDMRKPRLPHEVTINSLGYRNANFSPGKQDDEFRILMLGDSFTYGDFVDNDETLPAQLESALLTQCGGFRVINAGVGGTTIVTHTKMLQRGLPLEPDLVILVFSENDVDDLADPLWYRVAENRRRKSRFPLSLVYPIARHSALWNLSLEFRAKLHARAKTGDSAEIAGNNNYSVPTRLREEYTKALVELHENLQSEGIPFILVVYPLYMTVNDGDRREQIQWISQTAMNNEITTISLLPPLLDSAPVIDSYLLPYDGHPSARGHSLAADYLATQLQEKWGSIFGNNFRCTPPIHPASQFN